MRFQMFSPLIVTESEHVFDVLFDVGRSTNALSARCRPVAVKLQRLRAAVEFCQKEQRKFSQIESIEMFKSLAAVLQGATRTGFTTVSRSYGE